MALTKRYVSAGAEEYLDAPFYIGKPIGYVVQEGEAESGLVQLVDYMGGDPTVLRVATAGHGKSVFKEKCSDADVFFHLVSKGILTPFRSVQLQFLMQPPIEVALDFVYDPKVSVNEYSGRYSVMLNSSYLPSLDTLSQTLSGENIEERAKQIHTLLTQRRRETFQRYEQILSTDFARELARAGLGIDNDTRFYWKIDLVSLADFVMRKRNFHPSGIARDYVEAVAEIAEASAPDAWHALLQYNQLGRLPLTLLFNDDEIVDPPLSPAHGEEQETKRVTVPALEEVLFLERKYLNDGAFQVVDYLGDDSTAAQAARTSYGKGTKKLSDDIALVRTLVRDLHTSPIEMTSLAFESKTPVFVDPRQAGRHRTLPTHQFLGFTPLGSSYYLPPVEEMKYQDRKNRQGRGNLMEADDAERARTLLQESYDAELVFSQELRSLGASEELVRAGKGVGFYTRGWRCGDGHNLGHFLRLRLDPHAQKEIRDFAALIDDAHRRHTPTVNRALYDYHIHGMRLSRMEVEEIAEYTDLSYVDTEYLDTYRRAGFVKRRKNKKTGEEEEFLNLDGQGLQKKLRTLRDSKK